MQNINDKNLLLFTENQNNNIQPSPNGIEVNNNSQNNISEPQINPQIINNQNINTPIQEEEKKIIITKPFLNNEANEPIVIPKIIIFNLMQQ